MPALLPEKIPELGWSGTLETHGHHQDAEYSRKWARALKIGGPKVWVKHGAIQLLHVAPPSGHQWAGCANIFLLNNKWAEMVKTCPPGIWFAAPTPKSSRKPT